MSVKQLVIAVDGTAEMGFYWAPILSDYLVKIIRYIYFYFLMLPSFFLYFFFLFKKKNSRVAPETYFMLKREVEGTTHKLHLHTLNPLDFRRVLKKKKLYYLIYIYIY